MIEKSGAKIKTQINSQGFQQNQTKNPWTKIIPTKKKKNRMPKHSRHSQTYFVSSITLRRMTVTSDCFEYAKKKEEKNPT